MIDKKKALKSFFFVFLFISIMPSFTIKVQATLILEEPKLPEIPRTWSEVSLIYDDQYHNTSALWDEIDAFEAIAPQIVDVENIGQSYFAKDIKALRITNELRTQQKAKTLVVAHHHGREQITVEMALRFIVDLLNGYGQNNQITDYINTQEIFIIPTINPDALDIVVNEHNYWLRKNARPYDDDGDGLIDEDPIDDVNGDGIVSGYFVYEKIGDELVLQNYYYYEGIDNDGDGLVNEDMVGHVDLNRNYDMFFRDGGGWENDSQSSIYPGLTPFSEPETQVFRDFALEHRFAMAYSLHSGINKTYFVGSSEGFEEPDLVNAIIADFVEMLPDSLNYGDYLPRYTSKQEPIYKAGIWDNWMYFERESLIPMTIEVYGNLTARAWETEIPIVDNDTHLITEWKEIFQFYNPEQEYINDLWADWQPAFPYLLLNTPRLNVEATINSIDEYGLLADLTFTCTNLSPKLRSITTADIFDSSGIKIDWGKEILADSTIQIDATIPVPGNGSCDFKIGNEYVGYYHYSLKTVETTQSTTQSTAISFSIIGLAAVVIGISSYILRRKRK